MLMTQHYELILLVSPQVADSDLGGVLEKIKKLLADGGASITKEEPLGRRRLAYPIAKQRQGVYHLIQLDAPTAAIADFDRALRLTNEVLRHLIVVLKIRSAEELEREQAIRAKIEARRRAAAAAKAEPKPATKPGTEEKVSLKELDEKLEKILEEDVMK